jgi:signal peptidase I
LIARDFLQGGFNELDREYGPVFRSFSEGLRTPLTLLLHHVFNMSYRPPEAVFEIMPEAIMTTPARAERRSLFGRITPETRRPYILLCIVLWSIISYLLISHFVLMSVQIKGASMNPTLQDGQRYLLYRFTYFWRAPRAGEIVVIRDPQDHDLSIKRIIGRPNDLLEIRRDGVYVNDTKLAEPYLPAAAVAATGNKIVKPSRLGPNDYFVLGDNRDYSADSRIYGPVPRNFILGVINKTD